MVEIRTTEIQQEIISKLPVNYSRIDRSIFKLENNSHLLFRCSKAYKRGELLDYWFGISKEKFEYYLDEKFFVLFVCGSEHQVLIIPSTFLLELFRDVETAIDNNWKIHIFKKGKNFEIYVSGKENQDITRFLNAYNQLTETKKEEFEKIESSLDNFQSEQQSIEEQIMSLDEVNGTSLHDKLVSMLVQIGTWMKYRAIPNFKVLSDAPYKTDIAWLIDDAIHIGIEVQISGNITEAKDRLIFAKRFGARKCIIVSNPESVDRIKSLFQFEAEIKHWVEIWGLERIYNMFVDGRNFFENFNEFNKHSYRNEIVEII